jgi:uncharacterized protein (TIGR02452 family)
MNRDSRAAVARRTLDILAQGRYTLPGGRTVAIEEDVRHCVSATQVFQPEDLRALVEQVLARSGTTPPGAIQIENETTLSGIARLLREGCATVAALNFASAKNPGGGFLSGSQAQEESLARSSALHASLMQAGEFYERGRATSSALYTDALILSPRCPVFRDDSGAQLEEAHHATFISGAAPNAGALQDRHPKDLSLIPATLRRRAEYVLALAVSQGYRHIVLGAWGCGVFRNDPQLVAETFMELLCIAGWERRFSRMLFSIFDPSPDGKVIEAFRSAAAKMPARARADPGS